jgi:hypothetical protein
MEESMKPMKWIGWVMVAGALAAILALVGGVGQAAAAPATASNSDTDIGVGILQTASSNDGTLTYTVTIVNDGEKMVKYTTVTVPFDAKALQALDGSLSNRSGSVSITPGAIEIKTSALGGGGDSVQATLHFRALPGSSGGLTQRASYSWKQGSGVSNLPLAAVAHASLDSSVEGSVATFSTNAFGSREPVTFWYNTPSGQVVATRVRDGFLLDAEVVRQHKADNDRQKNHHVYNQGALGVFADDQGSVSVQLSTKGLAPGVYSVVARGNTSGLIAVGTVAVK